jgi:hypothetical protein
MQRNSESANVTGLDIYTMFLKEEWGKIAEYNKADAQETLQLFLRQHVYAEFRQIQPGDNQTKFLKVPMHEAAQHAYADKSEIIQILNKAQNLRNQIETHEKAKHIFYDFEATGDHASRIYVTQQPSQSPAKTKK